MLKVVKKVDLQFGTLEITKVTSPFRIVFEIVLRTPDGATHPIYYSETDGFLGVGIEGEVEWKGNQMHWKENPLPIFREDDGGIVLRT